MLAFMGGIFDGDDDKMATEALYVENGKDDMKCEFFVKIEDGED